MKNIFLLIFTIFIFSCQKMVDKPKNLLSKEKMSEVIADFAIYDQTYAVKPNANMELVSRFVLKKHNITAEQYRESYKYYLSTPEKIDDILENAKEIILDKDPKLEDYIEKKNKANPNGLDFAK